MSSQPLVTITIPAFNAQRFLPRTLASALNQTHANLEVIVVDDGSTDATRQAAEQATAADSRVRVITVTNGGVASARNIGIQEGRGEFIAFLDADDLWHPQKIADQVAALTIDNRDGAAASYTLMRIIDVHDRVVRSGSGVGHNGYTFARHLFSRPVGNGSSLFLSRQLARSLGGFDSSWSKRGLGGCEDLDLELRIAGRYPIAAVRRYLVGYRAYTGNMSSDGLALARSVISTVEHHIQSHPELTPWAIRKVRASTLEYALQNIASAGDWKLFWSEMLRLQRLDLGRGLEYGARFYMRRFRDRMRDEAEDSTTATKRPYFYSLSPDAGTERLGSATRPRDSKVVDQLAVLDDLHYRALQEGLIRSADEHAFSRHVPASARASSNQ